MLRIFKFTVSCALAVCVLTPSVWAQSSTVLTTSYWLPPNHHLVVNMMEPWAKQVEEVTEGRVKLRTLPAAPMGAADFFDGIRNGLQDVGFSVHGYTPGRFVLTNIAELPFLGNSAESMSVAYQRVHERYLAEANEHRGLVVLAVFAHGPGQIFNTKQPINSIGDLDGLKFRVASRMVSDAAKLLGTTAFVKPASESYELLSSGVADGIFFPLDTMVTYKLANIIEHATLIPGGFYNISFAVVMNKKTFDRLSKEDQQAIMRVSGENLARLAGRSWDGGDKKGLEALKQAGADVRVARKEFVDSLKETLAPLEAQWIEAADKRGVDGEAALAAFREELRKLEAGKQGLIAGAN